MRGTDDQDKGSRGLGRHKYRMSLQGSNTDTLDNIDLHRATLPMSMYYYKVLCMWYPLAPQEGNIKGQDGK